MLSVANTWLCYFPLVNVPSERKQTAHKTSPRFGGRLQAPTCAHSVHRRTGISGFGLRVCLRVLLDKIRHRWLAAINSRVYDANHTINVSLLSLSKIEGCLSHANCHIGSVTVPVSRTIMCQKTVPTLAASDKLSLFWRNFLLQQKSEDSHSPLCTNSNVASDTLTLGAFDDTPKC